MSSPLNVQTNTHQEQMALSPFYVKWYKTMLLIRKFEDKAAQLYGQQKIKGFCHLYSGQEACITGAVTALQSGDKYITAYRDHGHPIALGTEVKQLMAELYGKSSGVCKGYGGSMHFFDKSRHFLGGHGIVGGHVPLGAGIAFAEKYTQTANLCITFMGDGAARQGVVYETLNLAMLYRLPIIFVIENNGYAMGTSVERSSNVKELYRIAESHDMEAAAVDGLSVEAVHCAVANAATKARKGIPSLLEFVTYRYRGHSISDPGNYRSREELEHYKTYDPISTLRKAIIDQNVATQAELKEIDQHIQDEISQAVAFAEASDFPDPASAYDHVYHQMNYPFLSH